MNLQLKIKRSKKKIRVTKNKFELNIYYDVTKFVLMIIPQIDVTKQDLQCTAVAYTKAHVSVLSAV